MFSTDAGIPLSVPCLRGNEWAYIKECLDTNWVSSVGPFVERFEAMVAQKVGARFAVATVNGTSALHIALLVAGVKPGDEVVLSDLTFIAPANAVRYVGAWPVFVDAEPRFWQIDPEKLCHFLEGDCVSTNQGLRNRHTGRIVKAIMPVHILGHPCDMLPIMALAGRYGLTVIEDASEGLGTRYDNRAVGHLGHIACFSFNGNKIITTGGGGMIVTDQEKWAQRARYLTTQAKDDPLEFVHGEIGYNYRLTNISAAMGCAQMECLSEFISQKRATAATYSKAFAETPGISVPNEATNAFCTFWLYTILIEQEAYGMNSRALLRCLEAQGIQTRPLWQPLHMSPAHQGSWTTDCSVSVRLNRDALSLPCSVGVSTNELEAVIAGVNEIPFGILAGAKPHTLAKFST